MDLSIIDNTTKNTGDVFADSQHYVRVTKVLHNRFVEFEYSLGDPTICAELVLPFPEFSEFCAQHGAKHLTATQQAAVDFDRLKWRYGKPGVAS